MVYMNFWIVMVSFILVMLFMYLYNCLLYVPSTSVNSISIEAMLSSFLVLLLLMLISPSFLVLLDYDVNMLPSYVLYCTGLQWLWTLDIVASNYNVHYDHVVLPSSSLSSSDLYMHDITNYIILPLYATIKMFFMSADVIHSFGINSFGIKIDAVPSQINIAATLRPSMLGEQRGYCYELCGQGHTSMIISCIVV
jgi:cytochrome c oxidase subunit 2